MDMKKGNFLDKILLKNTENKLTESISQAKSPKKAKKSPNQFSTQM